MWIVLVPQRWDAFESTLPRLPIKINPGKMCGYLPVYETLGDARAEFPDVTESVFREIRFTFT